MRKDRHEKLHDYSPIEISFDISAVELGAQMHVSSTASLLAAMLRLPLNAQRDDFSVTCQQQHRTND